MSKFIDEEGVLQETMIVVRLLGQKGGEYDLLTNEQRLDAVRMIGQALHNYNPENLGQIEAAHRDFELLRKAYPSVAKYLGVCPRYV